MAQSLFNFTSISVFDTIVDPANTEKE